MGFSSLFLWFLCRLFSPSLSLAIRGSAKNQWIVDRNHGSLISPNRPFVCLFYLVANQCLGVNVIGGVLLFFSFDIQSTLHTRDV